MHATLLEIRCLFIYFFYFWLKTENKYRKKPWRAPPPPWLFTLKSNLIKCLSFFNDLLSCIYHVVLTTFKINHFRTKTRLFLPLAIHPQFTTIFFWTIFSMWHIVNRLFFEFYGIVMKILKASAKNCKVCKL